MNEPLVQKALASAVEHHQAGSHAVAEAIYRQVLVVEPGNADALHLLGMILCSGGQVGEGIGLIEKAVVAFGSEVPSHVRSNLADALRDTGRFAEAEQHYRVALGAADGKGRSAEVLNNLGITLMQLGRDEAAAAAFEDSLRRRPSHPGTAANLAGVLVRLGRGEEALAYANAAIAASPGHLPIRLARAGVLRSMGRYEEALEAYRETIAGQAAVHPGVWVGMADTFRDAGRFQEAAECSRLAINATPDDSIAWINHGVDLAAAGRHEEAITAFTRAIDLAPGYATAHANLGASLLELGRPAEAVEALQKAVGLDPSHASAWRTCSVALLRLDRREEAMEAAHRGAESEPKSPASFIALGNARLAFGTLADVEDAKAYFAEAIAREAEHSIEPLTDQAVTPITLTGDGVTAFFNHALTLLLTGEWEQGWREFELRRLRAGASGSLPGPEVPRWHRGVRTADGRLPRVLVHAEQGVGDAIQFAAYAPLIAREASAVIVQCLSESVGVVRGAEGVTDAVAFGEPVPAFDVAIASMSLPLEFGTTPTSTPALCGCPFPYIRSDMVRASRWRSVMVNGDGRLRVGLVWAGSKAHANDRHRSIRLRMFESIVGVDGVAFFSLQKGPPAAELTGSSFAIEDLGAMIKTYEDTAAVLDALDLLITVDTSVCHLAGAMARPVWTLLPTPPDWRWLLERTDTPWYPTMKLYRQRVPGEWHEPLERVASDLRAMVARRSVSR